MRLYPFVLLFASIALPAHAATFKVGVETTQYQPVYGTKGGQYVGYSRDLLDAFAKKHGHQFEYVPLPIKRLFGEFTTTDTLDFKYPDHPQWQPDMKKGLTIAYSAPVFEGTEGALVQKDKVGRALGDLKTLGTLRGFSPWPYMDALKGGALTLEESDDIEPLLRKLLVGRLDAVFLNDQLGRYYVDQVLKQPGAIVLDPALPSNPVAYLLSTRKHPEIIDQFDAFLTSEGALIAELRKKHGL